MQRREGIINRVQARKKNSSIEDKVGWRFDSFEEPKFGPWAGYRHFDH